jgi:hypothetical protein
MVIIYSDLSGMAASSLVNMMRNMHPYLYAIRLGWVGGVVKCSARVRRRWRTLLGAWQTPHVPQSHRVIYTSRVIIPLYEKRQSRKPCLPRHSSLAPGPQERRPQRYARQLRRRTRAALHK